MTNREKRHYYISYLLLFCVMAALIGAMVRLGYGRTALEDGDALSQHQRALAYWGEYLRSFLYTLVHEHRLVWPEWAAELGYGSNVFTTLHYYAIGDPLTLLAVFFPASMAPTLYMILAGVRCCLAGMTYSAFCIYMQEKAGAGRRAGNVPAGSASRSAALEASEGSNAVAGRKPDPNIAADQVSVYALLAGSILYAFCLYALVVGCWHAFFLNVLVYFPLVLLGVEKVLRRGRPFCLIFSVCLCALSNFYFFYMIVLFTVVYAVVRSAFLSFGHWPDGLSEARRSESVYAAPASRGWRRFVGDVLRIGANAAIGVLLSCFLFLPVVYAFLHDYRSGISYSLSLFYEFDYYASLVYSYAGSVVHGDYTLMGYGACALIALLLLLSGRRHRILKVYLVLGLICLALPAVGYVTNGLAYVSNRWSWVMACLAAYILVVEWDELFTLSRRRYVFIAAGSLLYALLGFGMAWYMLRSGRSENLLPGAAIYAVLTVLVLWTMARVRVMSAARPLWAERLLLSVVCLSVLANAYVFFSPTGYDEAGSLLTSEEVAEILSDNPDAAVASLSWDDPDLSRYGGDTQLNSNTTSHTRNLQYFWSLSNGRVSEYLDTLGVNVLRLYNFSGLDDRTMLTALAGVRYYVRKADTDGIVPYGYTYLGTVDGYDIYENEYLLPLGTVYTAALSTEDFAKLNAAQKEEALMQAVVLEDDDIAAAKIASDIDSNDISLTGESIPFHLEALDENVSVDGMKFEVSQGGAEVALVADVETAAGEYSWIYDGFSYEGPKERLHFTVYGEYETATASKYAYYYAPSYKWPRTIENLMVTVGCCEDGLARIVVRFSAPGTYTFEDMMLWRQNLTAMDEYVAAQTSGNWQLTEVSADRICGHVSPERDSYLLLTIPYDGGWSAAVDGESCDLMPADVMYTALRVTAGDHEIVLTYHTPWSAAGRWLSLLGALLLVVQLVRYRRKASL